MENNSNVTQCDRKFSEDKIGENMKWHCFINILENATNELQKNLE